MAPILSGRWKKVEFVDEAGQHEGDGLRDGEALQVPLELVNLRHTKAV